MFVAIALPSLKPTSILIITPVVSGARSLHRNYIGAVERAERPPSIVVADRKARALGATLAEMFTELERPGYVSHRAAVP